MHVETNQLARNLPGKCDLQIKEKTLTGLIQTGESFSLISSSTFSRQASWFRAPTQPKQRQVVGTSNIEKADLQASGKGEEGKFA